MIFDFLRKIPKLFIYSYKSVHILVVFVSIVIQIGLNIRLSGLEDPIIYRDYLSVLNTLGILGTFFVLALDKINFVKILKSYVRDVHVPLTSKTVPEGSLLTNTLFSIFIVEVLLITLQYIMYMFEIKLIFLLILSTCYMLIGFIFVVCVWHGIEIHSDDKK